MKRTSDIDIAVLPRGPFDGSILARLRTELEESTIPYRVDVVNLQTVSAEFRERVMVEAIRWD